MKTGMHMIGRTPWNKGLKGSQVSWNKGIPWSDDMKKKMSDGHKRNTLTGKRNPFWAGGKSKYSSRVVKERDGYTCQRCGLTEKDIVVVDHTIPVSIRPDLRFDFDNMKTLCPNCHARKTVMDRRNIAEFKRNKKHE